ncbi:hypothetical protein Aduo_018844 [Ancylostoma duodenale]
MFVYGLPVEVYTDHQALTALFKRSSVSNRVLRWALELQKYNLKMIYLKGAANRVADALSRGATPVEDHTEKEHIPNELIVATTMEEPDWTRKLRRHPVYGQIMDDLEQGKLSRTVKFPEASQKYKELAIGTRLAREYAHGVNEKMRDRMKAAYDREK